MAESNIYNMDNNTNIKNKDNNEDVGENKNSTMTPQHFICASLLGRLAELVSSAPQEVINTTIKSSANNIYKMLKLGGHLKDNYISFEELIRDLNSAFEFCSDLKIIHSEDCIAIVLSDTICGCKYCPKMIGEAEIDGTACPIPILFEQIGKKEGFDYTVIKTNDSCVVKKGNSCIIKFSKNHDEDVKKKTWRESLHM